MFKNNFAWFILACITAATSLAAKCAGQANGVSEATVTSQINKLLGEMSTREKVGQLSQLFYFGPNIKLPVDGPTTPIEDQIARGDVGSLLFVTDPKTINRLQHIAVYQSPHHIPLIFGFDVIHGFRTIFPVPLAMAASWDLAMITRSQADAAEEARSVGIDWAFAPMVDIARDPRWGRIVEGAGEDPFLGSQVAAAQVRGFQGEYIGAPDHLLACVKHFAGYGAAQGGRDYEESNISDAQLENIYLPPFHAAVSAGVGSLMSAYMDLNDIPASGNHWLLQDVLRQEWGFKGFVVSDANAVKSLQVHGFAASEEDAAVRAFTAGVNMEMGIGHDAYQAYLPDALQKGKITPAQLDAAVRPILEMKVRLGLFDHPYNDEARARAILAKPEHRRDAQTAAEHSAVLLRNEAYLLPLKSDAYHKVAVIGPLADSKIDTLGSWAFQQDLPETVTVLEGLRKKLRTSEVSYAQGAQIRRTYPSMFDALTNVVQAQAWDQIRAQKEFDNAVSLARNSDLVVMVLGEAANMSGESASRDSLEFPGNQEKLLEAVVAAGKPTVLVLINGRPLELKWASKNVSAILEAWYPGTEGGNAVADLLTGSADPGGKLPITWPLDVGQVPMMYEHNTSHEPQNQYRRYWDEESRPLYPFGFGLSYTKFQIADLRLTSQKISPKDKLGLSVLVSNTGDRSGVEVVQLYTHQRYGGASRPVRELKGFQRVELASGESKKLTFMLGKDQLRYWNAATRNWTYDASTYDVWVGDDSTDGVRAQFEVVDVLP